MASIAEIYQRSLRKIGSITGTVSSGSTTTAVLGGLVGTTGDNTYYAGDRLLFLDGTSGNRERLITTWADSTGTATIPTTTNHTNEDYILTRREDYTLNETDEAFKKAMRETRRTYRQVIPFTPLLNEYPLTMDWLRGAGDVDAVFFTISPLMLHNEDFSLWENGASEAPDGYTLEGSNAAVARVSGGVRSAYAAQLTAPVGNLIRLTQAIPGSLSQWLTRRTFPVYIPMRAAMWCKTTTANSVRCFIRYVDSSSGSAVTTYAYSDYISGTGIPEFPVLSLDTNANLNSFEWGIEVAANTTATVSWAGMMQNTLPFTNAYSLKDSGSQAIPYHEFEANYRVRNIGGLPTIELQSLPATYGQLVVYCRRPFPEIEPGDDYDYEIDEQYARVLEAGLLKWMLESIKPNQDRARLDRVLATESAIWTRFNSNITDLPVPRPPRKMMVTGA